MCVCPITRTHVCTYVLCVLAYMHAHVCSCVPVRTHPHTCVHIHVVCACVRAHVCSRECRFMWCIWMFLEVFVCVCACRRVHACVPVCTRAHVCACVYSCTCGYMCMKAALRRWTQLCGCHQWRMGSSRRHAATLCPWGLREAHGSLDLQTQGS